MQSNTEENYLKAIFHLGQHFDANVSTNAIAENLGTKAATVTDMLKKLSDKGLVHYQKYQGVSLTESGADIAITLVRKHRLWEYFLVEKLGYRWDQVHDIAEQLEHIKDDSLIDRLDGFLGNPKYDPHGDPIPTKTGQMPFENFIPISQLNVGNTATVAGVRDHSADFLHHLDSMHVNLGTILKIEQHIPFDGSVQIWLHGKSERISKQVAQNILTRITS